MDKEEFIGIPPHDIEIFVEKCKTNMMKSRIDRVEKKFLKIDTKEELSFLFKVFNNFKDAYIKSIKCETENSFRSLTDNLNYVEINLEVRSFLPMIRYGETYRSDASLLLDGVIDFSYSCLGLNKTSGFYCSKLEFNDGIFELALCENETNKQFLSVKSPSIYFVSEYFNNKDSEEELLNNAWNAYKEKNYSLAINMVKDMDNNPAALNIYSLCLSGKKDFNGAVNLINAALKIDPEINAFHFNKAGYLRDLGLRFESVKEYVLADALTDNMTEKKTIFDRCFQIIKYSDSLLSIYGEKNFDELLFYYNFIINSEIASEELKMSYVKRRNELVNEYISTIKHYHDCLMNYDLRKSMCEKLLTLDFVDEETKKGLKNFY